MTIFETWEEVLFNWFGERLWDIH